MSHFTTIQDFKYLPFKLISPDILMCVCVFVEGPIVSNKAYCV